MRSTEQEIFSNWDKMRWRSVIRKRISIMYNMIKIFDCQIKWEARISNVNWALLFLLHQECMIEKCVIKRLHIQFTTSEDLWAKANVAITCNMVRTHLSSWNILGFLLRACKSISSLITTYYKHLQHNSKLFNSIIIDGRGTPAV